MKKFKSLLAFLLALSMVIVMIPAKENVYAATAKPADGTTTSQPFNSGTGGSSLFRIPAMVTTNNGTIVSAVDARWNNKADAGGIDTLVSYSKDNGATWNYTYANYLGDNNQTFNTSSATFIDPILTYDKNTNTIYMMVDLYVGGYAINTAPNKPLTGSGFTVDGCLKIKKSGSSNYNYYVKEKKIYDSSNKEVSGYTVDEYFNLVNTSNEIVGNLFYSNSAYQAYPTTYLYMTKSVDDGKTWSTPQLIKNVKNDTEYFYGVGPGNGIVTKDGVIMIPCYVYGGSNDSQKASFIYSTDNGATWKRTPNATSSIWSSESQLVELSDGTIRMFFRNGQKQVMYVDATGNPTNGYTWGGVQTTGLYSCSNTQMSAIKYSQKIDGQDAIIISYPASSSATGNNQWERTNGRIAVGLVNSDGTMNWKYNYSVNNTHYWYSSLAELSNGSIGLLYETGSEGTTVKYASYAVNTLANGAQIGETTTEPDIDAGFVNNLGEFISAVEFPVGDNTAKDVTFQGLVDGQQLIVSSDNTAVATVTVDGSTVTITPVGAGTTKVKATVQSNERLAEIGEEYTLDVTVQAPEETKTVNVTLYEGQTTTLTDETGNHANLYDGAGLDTNVATVTVNGIDAEKGTGTIVNKKDTISLGDEIIIGDGKGNYIRRNGNTIENTNNPEEATKWEVLNSTMLYDGEYYLRPRSGRNEFSLNVSTSSNYANWYYTDSQFWYYRSGSYYLGYYDGGWKMQASNQNVGAAYELEVGTTSIPASTTIEIEAKSEGNTSVQVGNTIYNITVLKMPEVVTLETTPFTSGTGNYVGNKVTKLTISTGANYDLNLSGEYATIGTWAVEDETIATVDQNGTVTGVNEGTTYVTYTTNGEIYRIPVVVVQMKDPGTNKCDLHISKIDDTTVTYSIDASTEFCEAKEGEAIYLLFNDDISVIFFGDPDEGYALTFMAATNSAGQYYSIPNNITNLSQLGTPYTATTTGNGPIYATKKSFTQATTDAMLWAAIEANDNGNDGFTGFSRYGDKNGIKSEMTFRSEKLPTVEKEVVGILGASGLTKDYREYVEGMTAVKDETVYFKVTVNKYASKDNVNYTNVILTDNLNGAVFYDTDKNTEDITSDLTSDGLNAGTHEYYVKYTIEDKDLDTVIKNTVNLDYVYQSDYSKGSFGGTANAEAKITATSFVPKDLVIDFGLPVTIDYPIWGKSVELEKTGSATYGSVTVSDKTDKGWTVTYTPTTILKGVDTVTIYGTNGAGYSFKVYPATTVYYEEGFATFSNALSATTGWTNTGSKGTGTQEAEILGSKNNPFGYTSKYANETTGPSNKTQAISMAVSDDADITFTGTGIDIYANCTTTTGRVSILIKDATTGAIKKLLMVETHTGNGTTDSTSGQANESASLPIASVDLGTHGTYSVTVRHSKSSADEAELRPVNIDGYRVYNTLEDSTIFTNDKEDNPEFYQLRDMVLAALELDDTTSKDYGTLAQMAEQVYNGISTDDEQPKATILSGTKFNTDNAQDLLDNGPKNELFLHPKSTLVFNVTTSRVLQLGMKAPIGGTSYEISYSISGVTTNAKTGTINSSTDMFYDLGNTAGTSKTYTITITNTGDNILSITDLKVCDDPNIVFNNLDVEDIKQALNVMGYQDKDATTKVNLVDYAGKVIGTTTLTSTGLEGSTATLVTEDIITAMNNVLPKGYAVVDETSITDTEIIYGETNEVNVQVGKVAKLTITFKKLFGGTTTVTLTGVQTSNSKQHTFTAKEIRNAYPKGAALKLLDVKVKYGSESKRTIIGF